MKLSNKTVIVTGAGRGIGRAMAIEAASHGATVVLADVQGSWAKQVSTELVGNHLPVEVDVADEQSVQDLIDTVRAELGCPDALIHCAGINPGRQLFMDVDLSTWQRLLNVNLTGTFLCGKAVAGAMIDDGRPGTIVNIASVAGVLAQIAGTAYGTSKAGVAHLTRTMAIDLAVNQIRVNAIAPGPVDTELASGHGSSHRDAYCARIPMGRYAVPTEIAKVAMFLISDDSSFMTGETVFADGGYHVAGTLDRPA